MGRGTILADLGEGQYSIKLDFGESRLEAQLLLLTGANSDLDTQIAPQQAKVNAAQAALDSSNAALTAAINAYVAGNSSPNLLPPVETAKLDQVAKEEALRRETVALGKLQGTKANNLRKIDDLNSYRVSLTLNAWCADYTEGASGQVATLEIPNEPKTVLIAPTGRAPVDADGDLRMRALMTAPQAYYNVAILPGWQKFKPTYRSGVITAINGDTADVALDEAKSSSGGIADIGLANIEFDVNQTSTLTNVPIVYQDCNGTAFEVGDAVVVQFMAQSWSTPRIIGFMSNPNPCQNAFFNYGKVLPFDSFDVSQITPGPVINYFGGPGIRYQASPEITLNTLWWGGDVVWIGQTGSVSWRMEGDPYNFPYVVFRDTTIDCTSPEFYAWLASKDSYANYFQQWHVCGGAVYNEQIGSERRQILYFAAINKEEAVSGNSQSLNETLYIYRKDLATNALTKVYELSVAIGTQNRFDETSPWVDNEATGNSFVHLTDASSGPLLSSSGKKIYKVIRDTNDNPHFGYCIKVSFHPTQPKAIFAFMSNWQYGYMQWIYQSGATFTSATGVVAAEYHPDDGRICSLAISNYAFDPQVDTELPNGSIDSFIGFGASFTATFSEGGLTVISDDPRRAFVGQLNVCFPQNNVIVSRQKIRRVSLATAPAWSRNFFSGAFTESYVQGTIAGSIYLSNPQLPLVQFRSSVAHSYLLASLTQIYYWVRVVYAKNRYYAMFYTIQDEQPGGGIPARLLSSEFTQAQIVEDTGVTFNDSAGSSSGLSIYTPARIGFTSK
jgi:hypothetical protein